jgi:hypothetical protein
VAGRRAGAAVAVYRRLRGYVPVEDPRAEELRRRLEESRTVAEAQHEEAASAEVPVDAVAEPEVEPERSLRLSRPRSRSAAGPSTSAQRRPPRRCAAPTPPAEGQSTHEGQTLVLSYGRTNAATPRDRPTATRCW